MSFYLEAEHQLFVHSRNHGELVQALPPYFDSFFS